jgi:hypothetical protein
VEGTALKDLDSGGEYTHDFPFGNVNVQGTAFRLAVKEKEPELRISGEKKFDHIMDDM